MTNVEIDDQELEIGFKPLSFPSISPEMIASIALGVEDELVVAARHGFTVEQYESLSRLKPFQVAVASQRAEFERSGLTFQTMAALQAAEVRDKVFAMAMANEATFSQALEALRTLVKLGNLEPKETKGALAGPGFSIHIDLGDSRSVSLSNNPKPLPMVIDSDE